MNHLYSLYDALVGINVPSDKAKAVVDAMERERAATIATKVDLQLLRQELIAALPNRDEVAAIRSDVSSLQVDLTSLRSEVTSLRSDVALVRKDLEIRATR